MHRHVRLLPLFSHWFERGTLFPKCRPYASSLLISFPTNIFFVRRRCSNTCRSPIINVRMANRGTNIAPTLPSSGGRWVQAHLLQRSSRLVTWLSRISHLPKSHDTDAFVALLFFEAPSLTGAWRVRSIWRHQLGGARRSPVHLSAPASIRTPASCPR